MEKATRNLQGKWNLVLVVLITVFFSSCDAYNFSEPQPVDQENRYDFPNSYLGSWTNADISDQDMYIEYHIHKNYVLFISQVKERITNGAWPRVNNKGEFRYPIQKPIPESGVLMTIRYDSLKRPVDTVRNYLFRSGFIYKVEEKGLSKGYTYKKEQDTIILFRNDTNFIDLGANAFLRPLDKDKYVLNIRNRILGEDNDWWRVMILEKNDDKSLAIRECTSKSGAVPNIFYAFHNGGRDIYYIDGRWTSADMLRLFKEGYFAISRELIKDKGVGKN